MLQPGPAVKITLHLNADVAAHEDYLHREILAFLLREEVSGATLLKLDAGFGRHHRMHTGGAPGVAGTHLPLRIEFIETQATVDRILPGLVELVTDGLIEAQAVTIIKSSSGGTRE